MERPKNSKDRMEILIETVSKSGGPYEALKLVARFMSNQQAEEFADYVGIPIDED